MNHIKELVLTDVHEYCEFMPVEVKWEQPDNYNKLSEPRLVVAAYNEGGHNSVYIDLEELVMALRDHGLIK